MLGVISGDYGKPHPAVVVQSNLYKNHPSITVCLHNRFNRCPTTFHLLLTPTELNGFNLESHIDELATNFLIFSCKEFWRKRVFKLLKSTISAF
ncbi:MULTISPECIES: type II toxin-antitoxin system PemK/MazF family toxin [spotted fever group]|uniref:PEMK-like protein n=1 Tax=Rickettsia philipii (strain 364D) TaxID=481009 RepID=H6PVG0_RICP3|nr:type II toxin-antitoxin system PemK/MazF family toxin [Rickettsia philipii]AFB25630.1 PEMK-like protein [Rickettsia philipii str. 364D]